MPQQAPLRPSVALGFALTFALVAVGTLGFYLHESRKMPSPAEIRLGNQAAIAELGPGDAFRPWPRWFADARVGLGRQRVLMADPMDVMDLADRGRVFQLIALPWLRQADDEAASLGLRNLREIHRGSRYLVRVGELPPDRPALLWDGLEAVRDAQVSQRSTAGNRTACTLWLQDARHCQRPNDYISVRASIRELGDQNPHRCIALSVPEHNASWEVVWNDLPAQGATLRFFTSNEFAAVRSDRGTPVEVSAFIDDSEIYRQEFGIHDTRFDWIEMPLPEDRETVSLRFELRAENHLDRFFCFRPQILAP